MKKLNHCTSMVRRSLSSLRSNQILHLMPKLICAHFIVHLTVLNVLEKPDEAVLMQLLFTNCIPTITYGCAVKQYSSRKTTNCNTQNRNRNRKMMLFAKLFCFNDGRAQESCANALVTRLYTNYLPRQKNKFRLSLQNHCNPVLSSLYPLTIPEEDEELQT